MFFLMRWTVVFFFLAPACWAALGRPQSATNHLHYFSDFSASSEAIFKIPDATCRKIDALSIFGALIDQTFASMPLIISISCWDQKTHKISRISSH